MTKENTIQNKSVYIEFIRIIAIFFVIYNHTSEMGFSLFASRQPDSFQFWIYMFVSVFCKVAVPLFFAISGALLLGKEESLEKLWKNRIIKMILILILFSIINYLNYCFYTGKPFRIKNLLVSIYDGPSMVNGHLWYLYAYIALLICIPFLRILIQNMQNVHFYYMIAIVLFVNGLSVIEYLLTQGETTLSSDFLEYLWIISDVIVYPCIGYFLHYNVEVKTIQKKTLWMVWLVNLLGIVITCFMTYYVGQLEGVINERTTEKFFNSFVIINCIAMFVTIRYIFEKHEIHDRLNKIILSIGKTTFGIYLIHQLVKTYLNHYVIVPFLTNYVVDSMVAVLLYCFGILLICYIIIWILLRKKRTNS